MSSIGGELRMIWQKITIPRKVLSKSLDFLCNIIIGAFTLIVLWILLQVTTFASFKIPTYSMEPAIVPGDRVIINKWAMGGRVFNIFAALNEEEYTIKRLPAFGHMNHGDIFAFNYPYRDGFDHIVMDPSVYYLKRCVGLPGDTLEIRSGRYVINSVVSSLGNPLRQKQMIEILRAPQRPGQNLQPAIAQTAYPLSGENGWTILEFGPLVLPRKGLKINVKEVDVELYRRLIEWETGKSLAQSADGTVKLGSQPIVTYTFTENYYFAAGDNCIDSHDSRYFGPVPESFIVGKGAIVWSRQGFRLLN